MFKKLHIQMTVFAACATGAILVAMTLICLFIAENGLKRNSYTTFSNNAGSCIAYLESQSVLSHQWLSQAENNYKIKMKLFDSGEPLFYDRLKETSGEAALFEEVLRISREVYAFDVENPATARALTQSLFFEMDGYYAAAEVIPKDSGTLSAVFLYPLDGLNRQLRFMRIAFALAVLFAGLALFVFSWFFTRRMLLPIEESRKKQTEFIASASHELRSPLAVIRSGISALEKAEPEEAAHFTRVIQKESDRMSRLVDDMLILANADNHSWRMLAAPCELDTLLLETYEKYQPAAREKELSLKISLPDEPLPPCTCDAARISQVLSILMDNALSYVPEKGEIRLAISLEDRHVLLSVADNGPGIPDSLKSSVFQRFYRADSSRGDKQHFGLGLSIAREIVLLHHGSIQVTDVPGGGAAFLIRLPLSPP